MRERVRSVEFTAAGNLHFRLSSEQSFIGKTGIFD
jgi:hypothetical protein